MPLRRHIAAPLIVPTCPVQRKRFRLLFLVAVFGIVIVLHGLYAGLGVAGLYIADVSVQRKLLKWIVLCRLGGNGAASELDIF